MEGPEGLSVSPEEPWKGIERLEVGSEVLWRDTERLEKDSERFLVAARSADRNSGSDRRMSLVAGLEEKSAGMMLFPSMILSTESGEVVSVVVEVVSVVVEEAMSGVFVVE